MKSGRKMLILAFSLTAGLMFLTAGSCKTKEKEPDVTNDVWDVDTRPLPKMAALYIDLSRIYRISKYRSSVGHDYSDFTEHCRSMKHYFQPFDTTNWGTVRVYAPVSGTVTRYEQEWAGVKIELASKDYPAFRFVLFHVNPNTAMNIGDAVTEGQWLGNHIGSMTMSDIAVIANDPTRQGRMVSYFDVLKDDAFAAFTARGVAGRSDFIISRAERDAHPLTCMGDQFQGTDSLENWVNLR